MENAKGALALVIFSIAQIKKDDSGSFSLLIPDTLYEELLVDLEKVGLNIDNFQTAHEVDILSCKMKTPSIFSAKAHIILLDGKED